MEQCQPVRQFLLDHFSMNDSNIGNGNAELELWVRDHLDRCSSCRIFQSDLSKLGGRLDGLEAKLAAQIQVPPLSYFETLVAKSAEASRPDPIVITPNQGRTGLNRREFTEILAFLGTGIAFLSGICLLLQAGLIIPVGILFGMIAMFLPLMILFKHEPE